jgi:hypothetical protein
MSPLHGTESDKKKIATGNENSKHFLQEKLLPKKRNDCMMKVYYTAMK